MIQWKAFLEPSIRWLQQLIYVEEDELVQWIVHLTITGDSL